MEKDDVAKYLKENLTIELSHDLRGTPDNQAIYTVAKIKLAGQEISKSAIKVIAPPTVSVRTPLVASVMNDAVIPPPPTE